MLPPRGGVASGAPVTGRPPPRPPQMKLLLLLLAALLAGARAEDGARLLASKSLLNRYAVEGRDLTLQYNIYNVGSRCGPGGRPGRE